MAGPVTITCPTCRRVFDVPTELLGQDGHQVIVRMDNSELYGHLTTCTGGIRQHPAEPEQPAEPTKALEVRPDTTPAPASQWPQYVAHGSRPCVMCGATSPSCLESLRNSVPCCGACGEGNTHPARHESVPCAEWPEHAAARP